MKERGALILTLALFLLVIGALNFTSLHFLGVAFSPVSMTGYAINNGSVSLYVEGAEKVITIYEPLNATHNFGIGDSYLLNLNVSADFFNDAWKYSLYDTRHGVYVVNELPFTPNTTLSAVRWGNRLTVYAHETDTDEGVWVSKNRVFYISVPNSAPLLGAIDDHIYVCEGDELNYRFNASDSDEDYLYASIYSGNGPFYSAPIGSSGYNMSLFKIFSGALSKSDVGTSLQIISVNDKANTTCCVDTAETNITVIGVNNLPVLEGIGAQTVWLQGLDNSFYHQVEVSDVEDGYGYDGGLAFKLNFSNNEDLFVINSTGAMNYTPIADHIGSYSLVVCVNDTALSSPHENISLCSVGAEAHQVCDDFTLTVTNQNRAPRILDYSPSTINVSCEGTTTVGFSVNVTDDDSSPYNVWPDINWYVDGILREHNEGKSYDAYNLLFGCGIRGAHNISAVVTDGAATTTQFWNLDVSIVACQDSPSTGGGGGGGGGGALSLTCNEKWVCNDWRVCQNVKKSFDAKSLSPEDYSSARELCAQKSYDERFCGFQITTCFDLAYCNNSAFIIPKPKEMQVCYFTENPNCEDGITNCHDSGCELLVDCGGPCSPCPTCSDKIQNQGEAEVDCGGPCPYACDYEVPLSSISYTLIGLISLLVLIGLFILYKAISIIRFSKGLKKKKRH
jgi:hypothetical protein